MKKLGFIGAMLLALVLARPSLSFATEPLDTTVPWSTAIQGIANYTNISAYITNSEASGWGPNSDRQISPTGDVDYFLISCGKPAGKTGIVKSITLGVSNAVGDLDMAVYTVDGKFVASSTTTTNIELVNLAAQNKNAFFVKVYGFGGATNFYSVTLACQ
jgi:hypothetical protein